MKLDSVIVMNQMQKNFGGLPPLSSLETAVFHTATP